MSARLCVVGSGVFPLGHSLQLTVIADTALAITDVPVRENRLLIVGPCSAGCGRIGLT